MRRLIFTLLLLTGCSLYEDRCNQISLSQELLVSPHSDVKDRNFNLFFDSFINDFKDLDPKPYSLYSYRYESLPATEERFMIGVCRDFLTGKKEIAISPSLYSSFYVQRTVVYHELGHCLFGLRHDMSKDPSFMAPSIEKSEEYYRDNWPKELEKFKKYVHSNVSRKP